MFGGQILQTVPKFDVYGLFHLSRQLLPHVSRNTCTDFHFSDYMHHYVYIHYYAFWLSPLPVNWNDNYILGDIVPV